MSSLRVSFVRADLSASADILRSYDRALNKLVAQGDGNAQLLEQIITLVCRSLTTSAICTTASHGRCNGICPAQLQPDFVRGGSGRTSTTGPATIWANSHHTCSSAIHAIKAESC